MLGVARRSAGPLSTHFGRRLSSTNSVPKPAHGGMRTAAGIVAGTVAGVSWCNFNISLGEHAIDWHMTGAMTIGTLVGHAVAPQASMMGKVAALTTISVSAFSSTLYFAYRYVDAMQVKLTPQDSAEIFQLTEQLLKVPGNTKRSMDVMEKSAQSTWVYLMEAAGHPKDSTGREVLTKPMLQKSLHILTERKLEVGSRTCKMCGKSGSGDSNCKGCKQVQDLIVRVSDEMALQTFSIADVNNDGVITYPEWFRASCMLVISHVDEGVREELLFGVLDLDNNGRIDKDELKHFVARLVKIGGVPAEDAVHYSLLASPRPATAEEITDKWMKKFDIAKDGGISRKEFHSMAKLIDFTPCLEAWW
jgi:Ca2+-binding EF-hand superfamily protein